MATRRTGPDCDRAGGGASRRIGALLCCVVLLAVARDAKATRLSPREIGQLKSGEIVRRIWRHEGSDVVHGVAIGVIEAPPAEVFRVIADVGRYKEFMKRIVESRIIRRENETYYFYYKINMPWPLSDYWFITKNVHHIDEKRGVYQRRWTLHKGSFARNDGHWQLKPWRGNHTLVNYSVVLQPRSAIPQFVINRVTEKSLPKAITNVRDRVKQLRRAGAQAHDGANPGTSASENPHPR